MLLVKFFSSLQQIAAAPDDQAPRIISIEKGKDLAGQFNLYSDRIDNLQNQILDKAKNELLQLIFYQSKYQLLMQNF